MTDHHTSRPFFFYVFILGLIVALPSLSIDIYVPVLSVIAKGFSTTPSCIQLSISAFMAGLSIAQLISGLVADKYGRKHTLIAGLLIYLVMAIICSITGSIELFIMARFLQGMGCSSIIVCAFAISRDIYHGKLLSQLLGYITSLISLAPVIAPLIGSFITVFFGWRVIFLFITIVTLGLICLVFFALPETYKAPNPADNKDCSQLSFLYTTLLGNHVYMFSSIVVALIYASYFSYLYTASFIFENVFFISIKTTGVFISINAITLCFGSFISVRLLAYLSLDFLITTGLQLMLASSFIMLILCFLLSPLPLPMFIFCMFLNTFSVGVIVPMTNSKALGSVTNHFATATAWSGFVRYGLASIMGVFISYCHASRIDLIAGILIISATISLFLFSRINNRGNAVGVKI